MSESFDNIFVDSEDEAPDQDAPDFSELFDEEGQESTAGSPDERFEQISETLEDPKPYFTDPNFYKVILTGEGETSKRMHSNLAQFLKAEDGQDRSLYRGRIIPVFWELAKQIATKINHRDLPQPKRLFLRYGVLLPTMINKDHRMLLAKLIFENRTGDPIHYVDEWVEKVARGRVNVSATDETSPKHRNQESKISSQLEKTRGRLDAQLDLIRSHNRDMSRLEDELREAVEALTHHEVHPTRSDLLMPYTEEQRALVSEINSLLRKLSNLSRQLGNDHNELEKIEDQFEEVSDQAGQLEDGQDEFDSTAVGEEMNTIRQMAKMCVGRQGNHFPVLHKQYFRASPYDIGSRENVINVLAEVERLDPGIFLRTFKQKTNRIVPNIILVPCYGDTGICWEPFERFNRATSRGRIAVPMYPKDLKAAVVSAMADLRWQVAKEKAAHYWMEEGLTGRYYQWFTEEKMKGDVKDAFIEHYLLWITKESEGTQKLPKDVRGIFWRNMPFPQEIKDDLKNRGYVYSELYKKDQNRAMSDGY
ncbi:MAG: hypothetical protein ACLFP6_02310 [Spirochaetaceae bacterium]